MKKALLLIATMLTPTLAVAQSAGCGDPIKMHGRLAVAPYQPTTLYECIISPDVATSIVAASNEPVGPVGADPDYLTFQKSANMLVVQPKPSAVNRSPNITFLTKLPDGSTRSYFFLFHIAGYGGVPGIQLTYQEDEARARREQGQPYALPVSPQVASVMKTAPFYSSRKNGGMNWEYSCMCASWYGGDLIRRPDISDNGQTTIISFKGSTATDFVISRLDRDGTEKPGELPKRATVVNFTPLSTGGPLTIPEVAEYWRVLSGNQVAAWRNDSYHPEQVDVRSGSQTPYVVRKVTPTPPPPKPVAKPQTTAAVQ